MTVSGDLDVNGTISTNILRPRTGRVIDLNSAGSNTNPSAILIPGQNQAGVIFARKNTDEIGFGYNIK